MEDMTGASAAELVPAAADDLVKQLNDAARRVPLWPFAALTTVVVAVAVAGVGGVVVGVLGAVATMWLLLRDRSRRAVVTFYEVEGPQEQWFQSLVDAWEVLGQVSGLWRINAAGQVTSTYQYKTNSGASTIISRTGARASLSSPSRLVTNIAVPSLSAGKHSLHFLPDRLLIREGRRYSDVSYAALTVQSESTRFIESGTVPRDGHQIDTTWQYVNVRGGPDRRFKNNRQLPVMQYGRMLLATASGLRWIVDCSRTGVTETVARVIHAARAPAVVGELVDGAQRLSGG